MALLRTVYGTRYNIIPGISHTPHPHRLLGPTRLRSILPTPLAEISSVPNFGSIDMKQVAETRAIMPLAILVNFWALRVDEVVVDVQ